MTTTNEPNPGQTAGAPSGTARGQAPSVAQRIPPVVTQEAQEGFQTGSDVKIKPGIIVRYPGESYPMHCCSQCGHGHFPGQFTECQRTDTSGKPNCGASLKKVVGVYGPAGHNLPPEQFPGLV